MRNHDDHTGYFVFFAIVGWLIYLVGAISWRIGWHSSMGPNQQGALILVSGFLVFFLTLVVVEKRSKV